MQKLIEYLNSLQPGEIQVNEQLERLVWDCWEDFKGSDETKMEGYKILHRMETAFWKPPIFSFTIERHGATTGGSIWAEVQRWEFNLVSKEADCEDVGRRMVHKMDARLNVLPIAQEVADLVLNHKEDKRLKWHKTGTVTIRTGEIIPMTNKQTTEGRRKRFNKALTEILAEFGWDQTGNIWRKIENKEKSLTG